MGEGEGLLLGAVALLLCGRGCECECGRCKRDMRLVVLAQGLLILLSHPLWLLCSSPSSVASS